MTKMTTVIHFKMATTVLKCMVLLGKVFLTNMATMEQDLEKDEVGIKAPALIICMKPSWKMEVLEKYNITNQFFMLRNGSFEHLNGKKTMKEIITEASFRMNEDFSIALTTYQNPMEDFSVVLNI